MWDIFIHDWWIGSIILVLIIVFAARLLANRLGSYWYLLAALLLYWLFAARTQPHDAYVFDLQWPFLVLVGALWLNGRWTGRTWGGRVKGAAPSPVVGSLLAWFILYTALYLHMNFFHKYVTVEWFDRLVTWLVPLLFWIGFIVATLGAILARLSGGTPGVAGARLARGGRQVVRAVVIFAMVFTVLANLPGDYQRARQGIEGWWKRQDHPNTATRSGLDVYGNKPSATATGSPTTSATASPTSSPDTATDQSLDQATLDALTVVAGSESSSCAWTGATFKTVAKPGDVDQDLVVYKPGFAQSRKYSDALQTPLAGAGLVDKVGDIKKAICEDPLYGVAVANLFASTKVGDKQRSLVAYNDWLKPYAVDANQVNDLASSFMPYYGQSSLTDAQGKQVITRNVEYQDLANQLGTLLDRMSVKGVQTLASTTTWHLANKGVSVGGIPEVEIDPLKDTKPALILEVRQKNDTCSVMRIGFNTADKRPEAFPVPSCTEQARQAKAKAAAKPATLKNAPASSQKQRATASRTSATRSTSSSATALERKQKTANECKNNGGSGCPPNVGVQDIQSNDTDTTSSATASEPAPAPAQRSASTSTPGETLDTSTTDGTIVVPDS